MVPSAAMIGRPETLLTARRTTPPDSIEATGLFNRTVLRAASGRSALDRLHALGRYRRVPGREHLEAEVEHAARGQQVAIEEHAAEERAEKRSITAVDTGFAAHRSSVCRASTRSSQDFPGDAQPQPAAGPCRRTSRSDWKPFAARSVTPRIGDGVELAGVEDLRRRRTAGGRARRSRARRGIRVGNRAAPGNRDRAEAVDRNRADAATAVGRLSTMTSTGASTRWSAQVSPVIPAPTTMNGCLRIRSRS